MQNKKSKRGALQRQRAFDKFQGQVWPTKHYGDIEVLCYKDSEHITIRFIDSGNICEVGSREITSGLIRDQKRKVLEKTIQGVGYIGIGSYNSVNAKEAHSVWRDMLRRCYAIDAAVKFPAYKDCTVHDEWFDFQVFAKWFYDNCFCECPTIDKDVLVKGNRIYSPDTCCIIPRSLNVALVKNKEYRGNLPIGVCYNRSGKTHPYRAKLKRYGVTVELGIFTNIQDAFLAYKRAKEKYLQELAEKYKSQISLETYNSLIYYQVEITD